MFEYLNTCCMILTTACRDATEKMPILPSVLLVGLEMDPSRDCVVEYNI